MLHVLLIDIGRDVTVDSKPPCAGRPGYSAVSQHLHNRFSYSQMFHECLKKNVQRVRHDQVVFLRLLFDSLIREH